MLMTGNTQSYFGCCQTVDLRFLRSSIWLCWVVCHALTVLTNGIAAKSRFVEINATATNQDICACYEDHMPANNVEGAGWVLSAPDWVEAISVVYHRPRSRDLQTWPIPTWNVLPVCRSAVEQLVTSHLVTTVSPDCQNKGHVDFSFHSETVIRLVRLQYLATIW